MKFDERREPNGRKSYPARTHYTGSVAREYLARRAGEPKWILENEAVARLLGRLPESARILDAPIGTARLQPIYNELGVAAIGVDVSLAMLEQAPGALRGSIVRGDVARLPFPDRSVDYVVSMRFLNWLPAAELEQVLGEFLRVAKQGLIVQIRVREPGRPSHVLRALRSLAGSPIKTLGRLSGPLRRRLANGPPSISIPDAADVKALFDRSRLDVAAIETVADGTEYSRRLFRYTPLRLFLLQPCATGAASGPDRP